MGIIETVLRRRYGQPQDLNEGPFTVRAWNADDLFRKCKLYFLKDSNWRPSPAYEILGQVYGSACGGLILCQSLSVSKIGGPEIYGLYEMEDFQRRPEIGKALVLAPDVCFFMHAANVWFYGVKAGRLYCYDSTFNELYEVGEMAAALEDLIEEWETAKDKACGKDT